MAEDDDSTRVGYAFVGYPASGKTTAGVMFSQFTNSITIETGDIVREGATEYFGCEMDALDSDMLGNYSTMRRDTDGGDYVAQDVVRQLEEEYRSFPNDDVVIIGMRDTESPSLFRDFFDEFQIIWVHADFDTRLERLKARNRDGEGEFDRHDLQRRDGRESMWGTSDLTFEADFRIGNNGTLEDLHKMIDEITGRQYYNREIMGVAQ